MSGVEESSKQKRPRISWKNEALKKLFLEACIHEVNTHGREVNSLKFTSWKNVGEKLKNECGIFVERRQMKNRYDYIRGKYNVWSKLFNKTENLYNPVTKSFNLTEEELQIEMKCNKHAEPLRNSPLLYPELCMQLFDGSTCTSIDGWGPTSKSSHPEEELDNPELNEDDDSQQLNNSSRASQETMVPTRWDSDEVFGGGTIGDQGNVEL
ncbi:L10-interacting MYB domain-containing protein-like [Hibiscus syriacus]|uniref:L10-interacting MYB domain-containing protein-like n=1 Tax=Hibiscus syriacus TaxID=106335 RepID=UPI0019221F29|nr:L10-interacting MYB domain-containing protein-like [Hibiscus syriacus]